MERISDRTGEMRVSSEMDTHCCRRAAQGCLGCAAVRGNDPREAAEGLGAGAQSEWPARAQMESLLGAGHSAGPRFMRVMIFTRTRTRLFQTADL